MSNTIILRRHQLYGLLRIAYGMGLKGKNINDFALDMTTELNKLKWRTQDETDATRRICD